MKLYEIANDYLALLEAIESGEIPEECISDTLEAIKGEIDVKADNIACMLKSLEADVNAFKAEENRLKERREQKERAYERLKMYLSDMLIRVNVGRVETARNVISFRKSEAVEVEPSFIEWAQKNRDDLLKYGKPTANLTSIKTAIKGGDVIEGATLVTRQNIQIN